MNHGFTNSARKAEIVYDKVFAQRQRALGHRATMQLPMDVRVASTQAHFGFVCARRGITPRADWQGEPPFG